MFSEQVTILLILFGAQAIFAGFISLLVYQFYKAYHSKIFLFWTWSWLAFGIHNLGSLISMINVFLLDVSHPFRSTVSVITVSAGLLQGIWLMLGFYVYAKPNKSSIVKYAKYIVVIGFISAIGLVWIGTGDSGDAQLRMFMRLGIKEAVTGLSFAASAALILWVNRKKKRLRLATITFLLYAGLQFFYFGFHFVSLQSEIIYYAPTNLITIDFLLIVLIGLGMIVGVLEFERQKLRKTNQQLDTFLYRSAHDLRTPIVDILGVLELIKLDETNNQDEYHELIRSQVLKADEVIKDIITLRSGQKLEVQRSKVDVKSVFEQIRAELVIRYPYAQKLRFEYSQNHEDQLKTDSSRLKAILSYLLSNAIQYHDYKKKDPFVTVTNQKTDDGYKLIIEDNGSGIEESQQQSIFKMFHRASKASKGSGLGLYIVKEAVEQLGGDVALTSKVEEGTCIEILLQD